MIQAPLDGETEQAPSSKRPTPIARLAPKLFSGGLPASLAERMALGMIARHGTDAAREATVRLNRMIDRGNLPARDLWACVVHVIHERRP